MSHCPPWYDRCTRGCPHPNGVILAGSSLEGYGMKVAFLDIRYNNLIMLPNLNYNLRHAGMNYDVDDKILTIAGGEKHDGGISSTRAVFQLLELAETARWRELPELSYTVVSPMVVNDDKYLYVLGGLNCQTCVMMCKEEKKDWEPLDPLPLEAGVSMNVHYCGHLFGGALWFKKKVMVFTRTNYLTLDKHHDDKSKKVWKPNIYGIDPENVDVTSIRHLTPILHEGGIIAGIQREPKTSTETEEITVEMFKTDLDGCKYWKPFESASTIIHSKIGAGRFLSVTLDDKTSLD